MNFQPKSDQQLAAEEAERQASFLAPAGKYPFEITNAEDTRSKAGNDMIHLEVTIYNGEHRITIDDYLLEKLAFKLKHFCAATNLLDAYQQGRFSAADCIGKSGFVNVAIEKGKENGKGGFFRDKNTIKDYVSAPAPAAKPQPTERQMANLPPPGAVDDSSDIPF